MLRVESNERRPVSHQATTGALTAKALCGVLLAAALALPSRGLAAEETFKPFAMRSLDGVQTSLSDVLGKVTLVVFFFPTCPFCNAAFPEIQRIHDTYKGQGLSTVWINVLPQEEGLIPEWRSRHQYTVPILLGGRTVQHDYKLTMTPTHYLLDARGDVISRRAGGTAGNENALEREIRQALAAGAR